MAERANVGITKDTETHLGEKKQTIRDEILHRTEEESKSKNETERYSPSITGSNILPRPFRIRQNIHHIHTPGNDTATMGTQPTERSQSDLDVIFRTLHRTRTNPGNDTVTSRTQSEKHSQPNSSVFSQVDQPHRINSASIGLISDLRYLPQMRLNQLLSEAYGKVPNTSQSDWSPTYHSSSSYDSMTTGLQSNYEHHWDSQQLYQKDQPTLSDSDSSETKPGHITRNSMSSIELTDDDKASSSKKLTHKKRLRKQHSLKKTKRKDVSSRRAVFEAESQTEYVLRRDRMIQTDKVLRYDTEAQTDKPFLRDRSLQTDFYYQDNDTETESSTNSNKEQNNSKNFPSDPEQFKENSCQTRSIQRNDTQTQTLMKIFQENKFQTDKLATVNNSAQTVKIDSSSEEACSDVSQEISGSKTEEQKDIDEPQSPDLIVKYTEAGITLDLKTKIAAVLFEVKVLADEEERETLTVPSFPFTMKPAPFTMSYCFEVSKKESNGQFGKPLISNKIKIYTNIDKGTNINFNRPFRQGYHVYEGFTVDKNGKKEKMAIKILGIRSQNVAHQEIKNLKKLMQTESGDCHPNIVAYKYSGNFGFGNREVYICMELCSKNTLHDMVNKGIDKARWKSFLYDITNALKHIHENKIVHRDLKPQNIMISLDEKTAKIGDFGISREGESEIDKTSPEIGTDGWGSPENYRKSKTMSSKSDIFSLGVVFYFTLSDGKHAYGSDPYLWKDKIVSGERPDLQSFTYESPEIAKSLILNMLEYSPGKRPTADEILKNNFFKDLR